MAAANATATMALLLQAANSDTQNCANSLGEVDPTTPAIRLPPQLPEASQSRTTATSFHFPDTTTFQNFQTAVEVWIANEK